MNCANCRNKNCAAIVERRMGMVKFVCDHCHTEWWEETDDKGEVIGGRR